ncbi:MAG: hypothetical protein IJX14_11075, partial [Clostridia bacterium]|nr:hypothetical protein [Clostridia bacterium]
ALNDEAGAIICSYPKDVVTPAIPIPYAQESMHGFEYALAGLMISEGMIDEGFAIVKSIRDRYRGYNRNPWNEIECGSNYARSMASFALMPIYAGYRFAMQDKTLGFAPIVDGDFRSIWAVDAAWGRYEKADGVTELTICRGKLALDVLEVPYYTEVTSVTVDGKETGFTFTDGKIRFAAEAEKTIRVEGK